MFKVPSYLIYSFYMLFCGVCSLFAGLYFGEYNISLFLDWEFFALNSCYFSFSFLFDQVSMLFMGCVLIISSMVVFYSHVYMEGDFYAGRFLHIVVLFIFSMMFLIISPNLISILLGWDGLGLVSYCLVIYFQNSKSYSAGMLTILTNRIGDVAILVSISLMLELGSWHFFYYNSLFMYYTYLLALFIVLAAFTSSAQIPFSSWLPAAMAAPTPVSALVHSSTLVTAGVYLLIRFNEVIYSMDCSIFIILSVLTMFMSGLGANFEYDLKSVIALSTLSQLGFMMSIFFLGSPLISYFHLLAHAFFSALLFLCAGLIIHCMGDSQDIRHMGCVVKGLPFTCACFSISSLSLCGLPFISGFYSKDLILESMSLAYFNFIIYVLFFVSVGLTACYSVRLVYYCISNYTGVVSCHLVVEDKVMILSMIILCISSIFMGGVMGWVLLPFPDFLFMPFYSKLLPVVVVAIGVILGYLFSLYNYSYDLNGLLNKWFLGNMWFMPLFSTNLLYPSVLNLSLNYNSYLDSGWGEFVTSKFVSLLLISSSKFNTYISGNLILVFISFIFMFLLILL